MPRILSGMTPTGDPHIGNYFGMMKPMLDSQDIKDVDLYFFMSDQHTFTSKKDPEEFRHNSLNCAIDWIALGIDPEKAVFFRQSDVRAHTELAWYLSCFCPMGLLERAHAFKDKTAKGVESNVGLFTYPVLMTADILLYDIERVPVGKDQKQHVEIARDIAIKFNNHYGETFVLPEAVISEDVQTIPGLDGAKMSKSYGNTIEIFADEKTLKKKVMSIQTESLALGDPIPLDCTPMLLHRLFENPNITSLEDQCRNGDIGFGDLKKQLLELIWEYFAPARARREKLVKDPGEVERILEIGAEKANAKAEETLQRARARMGMGRHLVGTNVAKASEKSIDVPITFNPALKTQFPQHNAGVIHIKHYESDYLFTDKIEELYQQTRDKWGHKKESEVPAIAAWRKVFSETGSKPTKYRCASESLLRRFNKEDALPNIHPLVDLCNAFSIYYGVPIAVYDLADVKGTIEVKKALGSEEYQTFDKEIEHPEKDEVIFVDDNNQAHSRRWCYRQSGCSAIKPNSSEILIVAESHLPTSHSDIESLLRGIKYQLEKASISDFVLTQL